MPQHFKPVAPGTTQLCDSCNCGRVARAEQTLRRTATAFQGQHYVQAQYFCGVCLERVAEELRALL